MLTYNVYTFPGKLTITGSHKFKEQKPTVCACGLHN